MRCITLVAALVTWAAMAQAQRAPPTALKIVVISGEDAVNVVQQKTAVRPLVEVRDANNLPVAGVPVTFSVAGPGASFAGAPSITVITNAAGQGAATGLTPTAVGAVQIQATAAIQGQTAIATIAQTNVMTAAGAAGAAGAGGISTGVVAGIIGGGAAVAGGTVVATRGSRTDTGGSRPTSTTPPATTTVDDRPPSTTPAPPATDPRPPTTTPTPDPRPPDSTPPTNPTPAPRPDDVSCTFTVDPRSIRAGSGGGTERVTVTFMPRDCTTRRWLVTHVPSFIEATPLEGEGDGFVTLRIAAHSGNFERTDAISIAGTVISISQQARSALIRLPGPGQ